jgi:hypothetical protein
METAQSPYFCRMAGSLAVVLAFILSAITVRANVYATDIRINGSLGAGVILPGGSLTISYILNDTATGGVSVRIYGGTNLIETLASTNGHAGTNVGLNSAIWSGVTNLAQGAYTVSITAASTGYATWTNITDDGTNFHVEVPNGISVNQNTNSPFYGRVFVANADTPFGIFKYNADGSPGDEGGFSSGGLTWGEGAEFPQFGPWKMAISADDKVYIDDFTEDGVVYEFDQTIATNGYLVAVGPDNYPTQDANPQLSGVAVTGTGTNTQIYMADENPSSSAGIIIWRAATNGVAAADDTGAIVAPINPSYLSQAPYDLALDSNGFIYTIQQFTSSNNSVYPLICFPPYTGGQETNAHWVGSGGPTLVYAYGVAVDATATLVAVAVLGSSADVEDDTTGGLYLYNATNGNFITNLDQTGGHAYFDVAWDNVGNLCTVDDTAEVWRAYSPPGTNQATTGAVPVIQAYNALLPPYLSNAVVSMSGLGFTLEGQSNVTYVIQHSVDLTNWVAAATNFSTNANRSIYVPAGGNQEFYRAMTVP